MTSPYHIDWSAAASRDLVRRIPAKVAPAVYEFIIGPLATNPFRVGKSLDPPLVPHYSARRGNYRVFYLIDRDSQIVRITAVAHRRNAYRGR